MLLAVIPTTIWASFTASLAVGLGVVARYVLKLQSDHMTNVRHEHVDDAKDELISTLQANHQALSNRVQLLEKKASGLDKALTEAYRVAEDLQSKLASTLDRYDELQKYAAPEAVKVLTAMAQTTNALLIDVLERLTSVESQQNSGINSLTEALGLLRERLPTVALEGPQK